MNRLLSGRGSLDSLFFCTLDLASGFWGIPIRESDQHITTFTTRGVWHHVNQRPPPLAQNLQIFFKGLPAYG